MIFEKMIRSGGKFIEKNASTILSVFASVGVGTTAFLAGKAACESVRYYDRNSGWTHDGYVEVPSKKEVFRATWKSYIPAAVSGGITIACVLSANALSKKQQASLMAAYILLLSFQTILYIFHLLKLHIQYYFQFHFLSIHQLIFFVLELISFF